MSRPRRLQNPCTRCESRECEDGRVMCLRCLEYVREYYHRRKAEERRVWGEA